MADDTSDLQRQIRMLQLRLLRIEQKLGLSVPLPPEPDTKPPGPSTAIGTRLTPPTPAAPPVQPPAPAPQDAATARSKTSRPHGPTTRPTSPAMTTASPPITTPSRGLELTIAVKWFAWVGALIVVLAAAFALREYGADVWARLAPAMKCTLVALGGAALLAGGEVALRRLGRPAAVGLFSAGLGVLYLDAYATFQFFDPPLVAREWSFVLMAAVALPGLGVTLRGRFLTIGVLSLIGGYITPILLAGGGHTLELLSYLTVLLGMALALSAIAPRPYRPLRYVALGLHLFVAGLWMLDAGSSAWMMALAFSSIWWTMILVESTLAAMRRQSAMGNPVAVVIATACYVTAGAWILDTAAPGGPDWLGLYTAGIAVIGAATALHFGPGLDGLRRRPTLPMDKLAVALWVQSGVLLIVAVAFQFDGFGRSIAWLSMAAAAIELGNRLRSRGLDIFGLLVGGLALLMVVTIDRLVGTLQTELWRFETQRFSVVVDEWSLLCLGAIIITHFAAHRLRASVEDGWRAVPVITAVVSVVYWLGLSAARADGLAITIGWALGAGALLALNALNRRVRAADIAMAVSLLAAMWWAGPDVLGYRGSWSERWPGVDVLPLVNLQFSVGLVVSALLGAVFIARRRRIVTGAGDARPWRTWSLTNLLPVVASAVVVLGLSMEVERVVSQAQMLIDTVKPWPDVPWRMMWITMLLAPAGAAVLAGGFARRLRPLLDSGCAAVVCTAVLWLTYLTLGQWMTNGIANVTPIINPQFGAGVACLLSALLAWRVLQRLAGQTIDPDAIHLRHTVRHAAQAMLCLAGAIVLWLGSFEVAHLFHADRMAIQMGLSVYWGLYAVALVLLGFAKRLPAARYVGLAMLSVTAVKVLTIDLATVEKIWRIVSLFVTGLLAIGVSIAYVKLAPRLDEARATAGH